MHTYKACVRLEKHAYHRRDANSEKTWFPRPRTTPIRLNGQLSSDTRSRRRRESSRPSVELSQWWVIVFPYNHQFWLTQHRLGCGPSYMQFINQTLLPALPFGLHAEIPASNSQRIGINYLTHPRKILKVQRATSNAFITESSNGESYLWTHRRCNVG